MSRSLILGLMSCVSVTACATVGPDYAKPETALAKEMSSLMTDTTAFTAESVETDWWSRFEDPVLLELLSRADANNADVEASLSRILQARAGLAATRSRGVPSVGASAGAQRLRSSELAGGFGPPPGVPSTQNLFGADLTAGWEIDLFGRLSRAVEAASARVELSEAESRAVRLSVRAATAESYFALHGVRAQKAVLRSSIETAHSTLTLTEHLAGQALASEFDLIRARAEVRTIEAELPPIEAAERELAARLAVLIGVRPDILLPQLRDPAPTPAEKATIPVGLPSDLLQRRPDIVAAERNLAAATAQIGIARAGLFPSISLTGNVGGLAMQAGDLFDTQARSAGLGGFINLPLFDAGARRAELTRAESEAAAALAGYRGTILSAFADVEAAMAAYVYGQQRVDHLTYAAVDRQRAVSLARARYEAGLDDLFALLDAQRALLTSESDLASARTDTLRAYVALFRSLGGDGNLEEPS